MAQMVETWAQLRRRQRDERAAAFLALAEAGYSRADAARALGISQDNLAYHLQKLGVEWPGSARHRRLADEREHPQRYALYRARIPVDLAARQLGLSDVALRCWAQRRGVTWGKRTFEGDL